MDMEERKGLLSVSIFFNSVLVAALCFFLAACANGNTPTAAPSLLPVAPTDTPFVPQAATTIPTPACTDGLTFIDDVTIPDYSVVAPGSSLDKQWQVENSGSCNWDSRYRLQLVSGDPFGATTEQALYPARAGAQTILRIIFTAPTEAGSYAGEWQAFGPDGIPFGESFAIRIVVTP